MKNIIRCKRCIMDNKSDDTILFDNNGFCNYCTNSLDMFEKEYFPNEEGERRLKAMLQEIKANANGKPYDCMMGLSGGLDSSYLTYLGYKWGLRVLVIHIDDGFDTEISKENIRKLIDATGFELVTIKPDSEQFNDLTKAYMKAGVANLAVPQDNVLFAGLYEYMRKYKIKYFLAGTNFALECILQRGNTFSAFDLVNLKDIHAKYGEKPIDKLPLLSRTRRNIDSYLLNFKTLSPLNYIDYNRQKAFTELHEFCGFEYYGSKHLENVLTAFVQLYWFPEKFGVDKRTSHLSSMIISGQMTREEALAEFNKPLYDEKMMQEYIKIIKVQLRISDNEFDEIMAAPSKEHTDYKYWENTFEGRVFGILTKVWRFIKGQNKN